jgi:molybdopterin-guanine dinucleotide biosynthesis protein A
LQSVVAAVVLAGGAARRLGGTDKAGVVVGELTLLDRVLRALDAVGTGTVVVVGPQRPTVRPVVWRREEPPGGGPVAGLAAGLESVTDECVFVLAADLPDVAPALPQLLDGLGRADAAILTEGGRRNHLVAVWRTAALRSALSRVGPSAGVPVRALEHAAQVVEVPDGGGWGRDCDSWDDVEAARRDAARREEEM